VLGLSRLIPRLQRIAPVHTLPTTFSQNIIHSNAAIAFRTYPNGYFPNRPAVLEQFTIYKHRAERVRGPPMDATIPLVISL